MPILEFTGIKEEIIVKVQDKLVTELSKVTKGDKEDFTLMLDDKKQLTPSYQYVNVRWFERPQEIQDKCAGIITQMLREEGIESVDVIFHKLHRNMYYDNGKHF